MFGATMRAIVETEAMKVINVVTVIAVVNMMATVIAMVNMVSIIEMLYQQQSRLRSNGATSQCSRLTTAEGDRPERIVRHDLTQVQCLSPEAETLQCTQRPIRQLASAHQAPDAKWRQEISIRLLSTAPDCTLPA